jgi:polyisoprenyl-phosphate glycosyltransferase
MATGYPKNSPIAVPLSGVRQIGIVLPVYDDWTAAEALLARIDRVLDSNSCRARILLVDDGSPHVPERDWPRGLHNLPEISILRLRRNLGHQRAIALGLVHVYENWRGIEAVVVMDADGEDRPEDIPALLEAFSAHEGGQVVFAARAKRLESAPFQFFYRAYRVLHKMLTGVAVRVGNFSVLPPKALETLMVSPELWNHYAAAIFRTRIPHISIPLARGSRLAGRSKMNFVSLLVHGFSAISVFSDVVAARLLAASAGVTVAAALAAALVAALHFFAHLATPAWLAYAGALLLVVLAPALTVSLALVFIIASGRAASSFLPIRDAVFFIDRVESIAQVGAARG